MTSTIYENSAPTLVPIAEIANERHAANLIELAIREAKTTKTTKTTIKADAARLIAATVHRGHTTALGRFAASGQLDHLAATVELWDSGINEMPIGWWRALDLYLQANAPEQQQEVAS